jgi:hypothetical protein
LKPYQEKKNDQIFFFLISNLNKIKQTCTPKGSKYQKSLQTAKQDSITPKSCPVDMIQVFKGINKSENTQTHTQTFTQLPKKRNPRHKKKHHKKNT